MVFLIASIALAAQSGAGFVLPDAASAGEFFRSLGFTVERVNQSSQFEISRDGDQCTLRVDGNLVGSEDKGPITAFMFWTAYEFKSALPEALIPKLPNSTPAWTYRGGLDGSLLLRSYIGFKDSETRSQLVQEIESLWKARRQLDDTLIRPRHGVTCPISTVLTPPLDRHRVNHSLSATDVLYLFRRWSWKAPKNFSLGGTTWAEEANVEGADVWIFGDQEYSQTIELSIDLPLQGGNAAKWVDAHRSAVGHRVLAAGSRWDPRSLMSANLKEVLDLKGGMSAGQFKDRLTQFAKTAKSLASSPN